MTRQRIPNSSATFANSSAAPAVPTVRDSAARWSAVKRHIGCCAHVAFCHETPAARAFFPAAAPIARLYQSAVRRRLPATPPAAVGATILTISASDGALPTEACKTLFAGVLQPTLHQLLGRVPSERRLNTPLRATFAQSYAASGHY